MFGILILFAYTLGHLFILKSIHTPQHLVLGKSDKQISSVKKFNQLDDKKSTKLVLSLSTSPTPTITPSNNTVQNSGNNNQQSTTSNGGSGSSAPTPTPTPEIHEAVSTNGWIKGRVMIGPTCPGPILIDNGENATCEDAPYQTDISIRTNDGQSEVAHVSTDVNGYFKVEIAPGTYFVITGNFITSDRFDSPRFPPSASQTVTVNQGETTEVLFSLDSGIR